ncbi:hypothetical protein [Methanosarcina siciliae]|nr:hypothetical protein [Methanosarcina siciliae]
MEDEPSFEPGEDVLLYLVNDTPLATKDLDPEHFVSMSETTMQGLMNSG